MIRIFMVGYSANKGGVEAYIENLCGKLDPCRFEIVYSMLQMQINDQIWIAPANRHNYIKYSLFWHRFFKENHFDALYYNTCDIVSIDMLRFAKSAGIPVRIIHSHNTGIQQRMHFWHRISEKRNHIVLPNFATHFFACSEVAGKWMFAETPFQVIKNGIELSKYSFHANTRARCRDALGIDNELLIGCVGRLENQKNLIYAIRLIEYMTSKKMDAHLAVIGDGSLRKELEDEAKSCGVMEHISFLGNRDDVNEWYSAFDCLLMPSLFEGLPFVLVEAQAAGLPCVVSSNVSEEANLTGLVHYLSLDAPLQEWSDTIRSVSGKERPDTRQQLIDAGYSIEETAKTVSDLIEQAVSKAKSHGV